MAEHPEVDLSSLTDIDLGERSVTAVKISTTMNMNSRKLKKFTAP